MASKLALTTRTPVKPKIVSFYIKGSLPSKQPKSPLIHPQHLRESREPHPPLSGAHSRKPYNILIRPRMRIRQIPPPSRALDPAFASSSPISLLSMISILLIFVNAARPVPYRSSNRFILTDPWLESSHPRRISMLAETHFGMLSFGEF